MGRPQTTAAGLTTVATVDRLVAAVARVAPRLDVPSRFWSSPIETVSIDGRPLRAVRVGYNQVLRRSRRSVVSR